MFTLNLKGAYPMSPLVYRMNAVLSRVVQRVPVGTNLGLFHCLWMLLSGRLLLSRGAVLPGLAALGLAAEAVRRAWAALAYGQWHAAQLLEAWEHLVQEEQVFHAHQYGGYRPVACDLVGFFRPRLQDCPTKHYSSAAGKGLPSGSSRRSGSNAMSSAPLSTSRRAGLPSSRIAGRGGNPAVAPWSAPSHAPIRGAPLPRHPRTARKPGNSVSGPLPCRY